MSAGPREVTQFLSTYPHEVRNLALQLRKLVLRVVPDAEEKVHRPWKTIAYGLRGKFCAISPHQSWVNLQFHGGSGLDDPDGLLEGTGKSMRHVKVRSERDAKRAALRKLVASAADGAR